MCVGVRVCDVHCFVCALLTSKSELLPLHFVRPRRYGDVEPPQFAVCLWRKKQTTTPTHTAAKHLRVLFSSSPCTTAIQLFVSAGDESNSAFFPFALFFS